MWRSATLFTSIFLSPMIVGCQTSEIPRASVASTSNLGKAIPRSAKVDRGTALLGYCDGVPITWGGLAPMLIELSGGEALSEYVLDAGLRERLRREGQTISPSDTAHERALFADVIAKQRDDTERLLRKIRQQKNLGEVRFAQMLWRNAALRRLVRHQIKVPDVMVRKAYAFEHGPKYHARLIVVPDIGTAGRVAQMAREGAVFADLAMAHSTDASRDRGGLLPPISAVDPTWPDGIRSMLASMSMGTIGDPVMVDGGYAILLLESVESASEVAFESVKEEMTQRARLGVEHDAMDRLAREILRSADLIIMQRALNKTWKRKRAEMLAEAR